jgi:ubiquitin C-terminal hydrolase
MSGVAALYCLRLLLAMEAVHDEKWGDGMQQDAQEFLHGLLNQLQVLT